MSMYPAIPTQPHSGLGITSLIISLSAGALLIIVLGTIGVLDHRPGGYNQDSAAASVLDLLFLMTLMAQVAALGLGIAALLQAGRNKLYGVLGTVFASTGLLSSLLVLLFGALAEG